MKLITRWQYDTVCFEFESARSYFWKFENFILLFKKELYEYNSTTPWSLGDMDFDQGRVHICKSDVYNFNPIKHFIMVWPLYNFFFFWHFTPCFYIIIFELLSRAIYSYDFRPHISNFGPALDSNTSPSWGVALASKVLLGVLCTYYVNEDSIKHKHVLYSTRKKHMGTRLAN